MFMFILCIALGQASLIQIAGAISSENGTTLSAPGLPHEATKYYGNSSSGNEELSNVQGAQVEEECGPSYELINGSCKECKSGSYKNFTGSNPCTVCDSSCPDGYYEVSQCTAKYNRICYRRCEKGTIEDDRYYPAECPACTTCQGGAQPLLICQAMGQPPGQDCLWQQDGPDKPIKPKDWESVKKDSAAWKPIVAVLVLVCFIFVVLNVYIIVALRKQWRVTSLSPTTMAPAAVNPPQFPRVINPYARGVVEPVVNSCLGEVSHRTQEDINEDGQMLAGDDQDAASVVPLVVPELEDEQEVSRTV